MFLFYCWFLTVLGTRVRGIFCSWILVCFLAKSVCSFECCCVLSLGEGGGGVLFCIKTSGMSITLLIEQNVYRYNALTDTLSLLFTTHRERFRFEWHLSFFSFFTFFFILFLKTEHKNGFKALPLFILLPSLVCLTTHKGLKWWWSTQPTGDPAPPPSVPQLHRAIDQTHIHSLWSSGVNIRLSYRDTQQMHSRALGRGDTDASLTPPQSATYYLYSTHIHS